MTLRPMVLGDVDRVADWFVDFEDVGFFDRTFPLPLGPEVLHEVWEAKLRHSNPPNALWFMSADRSGDPTGICGLHAINYIHGDAVIPIFVEKNARGKGLAMAMSVLLIDLAFEQLRLHRLTTYYRGDNFATELITKKTGFKEEGRTREGWYAQGGHKDVVQVGLLRSDWTEIRAGVIDKMAKSGGLSIALQSHEP